LIKDLFIVAYVLHSTIVSTWWLLAVLQPLNDRIVHNNFRLDWGFISL